LGEPRVAIVTGASGGIGRAIAVAFGGRGWSVALGARRASELDETAQLVIDAGGNACAHPLDVCSSASIDAFLAAVDGAFGPASILVNNAGIAWIGSAHEMSDDDHRHIVETNLLGPILLSKRVIERWRERAEPGDIVFVSSDTTAHPRPYLATYGASKAGLEAFATTLALECEGTAIRPAVVRVGPTLSGFADDWNLEVFEELMPYWQRFGIQRHFNTMVPEDVARTVVQVVTAPPHMRVPLVEVQPRAPTT